MAMVGGDSSKSSRGRKKIVSDINITPIVDVMLVLLVIFMITAPMLISGVKVDLPDATAKPIAGQEEPLAVSIDKNGKIYIMDTAIDARELVSKLKAITKEKMDTRIFVRGDQSLNYGKIMGIVGDISAAGFSKVALITNTKTEKTRN
jgi:biopolymer transport protein TolR